MNKFNNWIWKDFDVVENTNDEAKKLVCRFKQNCIVSAEKQSNGRGRRGRKWLGQEGNLFASFAFEIGLHDLNKMVILSSVALLNTVKHFAYGNNVKIKWPNDILVNEEKISGILFEKADENFWVMGIGINILSSPKLDRADYNATDFCKLGINVNRIQVLEYFVNAFDELLSQYYTMGFEKIKKTWLDNAYNLGNFVTIRQEKQFISGKFLTIDDNGVLILKTDKGIEKILVGDLFMNES